MAIKLKCSNITTSNKKTLQLLHVIHLFRQCLTPVLANGI